MAGNATFIILTVVGIGLMYPVHIALGNLSALHARRFCRRKNYRIRGWRWQPAFVERNGRQVKTEATLVQLDCVDLAGARRLVLLATSPFGVLRLLSDEIYPESPDEPARTQ